MRGSCPSDLDHRAEVGLDPTGQDTDPAAPTISWTAFPQRHGIWENFTRAPVRPATNTISVRLRARRRSGKDCAKIKRPDRCEA